MAAAAVSFLVISLLEFLIFIFGTFGNFITCYIVFRNKQLQISAYLFVASLAVADLLTCVLLVPTRSLQHLGAFIHNPSLTQFGSTFVLAIGRVTLLASFTNLAVLSIDRLIAVNFPFYYRLNLRNSRKSVAFVILGIWILSILFTSLPELKAIDQKDGLILFASCLITTTFIILFSNARVLFIVRKQSRFRRQLMPTSTAEQKIKPLHNSYSKSGNEDEWELENYQDNKPTSIFFRSDNTKQDMQENLIIVKHLMMAADSHHSEPTVIKSTRRCSLNLHEIRKIQRLQLKNTKVPQTSEFRPTNLRNTGYNEQNNGGDDGSTLNIRRASWPDAFSRNNYSDRIISDRRARILSKNCSSAGLEINGIEKGLPKVRPNGNIASGKRSATLDASNIRRTGNSEEKKTAISVVIVILVFVVLVYPRLALIFHHFFHAETVETTAARLWLRVLMYLNSAVNPVLYAWRMPKFRNALKNIITCKKC